MPRRPRRHWLVKSEPDEFSFDDLLACPGRRTGWDGVRNYQARNLMRDEMRPGDLVLFYHSGTSPPAVVGIAEVVSEPYPDPTQFDEKSPKYDPKATPEEPRWFQVDLRAVAALPRTVSLPELKADPRTAGMMVCRRGQRLSVQPVSTREFAAVCRLGGLPGPPRPGRAARGGSSGANPT